MAYWAGRSVLVTGGLGFIGSNLARNLGDLGAEVHVLDALIPEGGGNRANLADRADIQVTVGDVRDSSLVREAMKGVSVVFHLAAAVSHTRSMKLPLEDLELNCHASLVLLEARRALRAPPFLVYAGSRSQYGAATVDPVDESQPLRPLDVNGIHKATAESLVMLYDRAFDQPACSLRLGNVYGPRHQMRHAEQGFLHWFIRQAMDDGTISVFGGEQQRDFVYVDDVVLAMVAAASNEKARGEAFNIAAGESHSVRHLAELVVDVVGRGRVEIVPYPAERKAIEVGDFRADVSKARRCLNWQARTGIREGLERTVEFYRRHRAAYW